MAVRLLLHVVILCGLMTQLSGKCRRRIPLARQVSFCRSLATRATSWRTMQAKKTHDIFSPWFCHCAGVSRMPSCPFFLACIAYIAMAVVSCSLEQIAKCKLYNAKFIGTKRAFASICARHHTTHRMKQVTVHSGMQHVCTASRRWNTRDTRSACACSASVKPSCDLTGMS